MPYMANSLSTATPGHHASDSGLTASSHTAATNSSLSSTTSSSSSLKSVSRLLLFQGQVTDEDVVHIHTLAHIHTHAHSYTRTHTEAHTHAYTHINIFTQNRCKQKGTLSRRQPHRHKQTYINTHTVHLSYTHTPFSHNRCMRKVTCFSLAPTTWKHCVFST